MNDFLTLKTDFIFKMIFSREENKSVLKDFLEAILKIELKEIEVKRDATLQKISKDDKAGILDLKATLNNNKIVEIEMQVENEHNIEKRSLFYASKIISEQLSTGDNYQDIKEVIMINILNYEFIDLPEYHTETITVAKKHREYELVKDLTYHFIELPKFRKQNPNLEDKLEQWLTLIDGKNKEGVEIAMKKNKQIKRAFDDLEYLTGDEEVKRIAELRLKGALDRNSRLRYEREEGEKIGKKEGYNEAKKIMVKNMLNEDANIDFIAKVTGLSKEEIEKIRLEQ